MNIADIFRLDLNTGNLYWRNRTPDMFKPTGQRSAQGCCANWNSRYADKLCLTHIGTHGYKTGNVCGKTMLAHRVVFFLVYGFWPKYVDHINGNKLDNRPENLRCATNAQNIANSKSRDGSSSKYLGVCWSKNHNKWISSITTNYKTKHLGIFIDEIDAAIAYNKAAVIAHGEFARLNAI